MKWLARLSLLLAALLLVALIWVRPSPRALREYRVALGFAPEGDLVSVRFEAVDVSDILKINQLMRV